MKASSRYRPRRRLTCPTMHEQLQQLLALLYTWVATGRSEFSCKIVNTKPGGSIHMSLNIIVVCQCWLSIWTKYDRCHCQ